MKFDKKLVLSTLLTCLPLMSMQAEVKTPRFISDGMVLQRNETVRIWGTADPGEKVTVTFLKKKYSSTADADGNWMQEDSHHTNNDGTINPNNLKRDTGSTDKVLICNEFVYLGKSMISVPDEYDSCIYKRRGFYYPAYDDAKKLWDFLMDRYPGGGKIDQPNQFKDFKRYDGIS